MYKNTIMIVKKPTFVDTYCLQNHQLLESNKTEDVSDPGPVSKFQTI